VYGFPVARVTYQNHPNDIAVGLYFSGFLTAIGDAMLGSIGAIGQAAPVPTPLTSNTVAPRFLVHQHGTMRMGKSPKDSVVSRYGQFWHVPNLFVADGSLFSTAGGYTRPIPLRLWPTGWPAASRWAAQGCSIASPG
jgi:choline dehydrogenase-like flavoprotein